MDFKANPLSEFLDESFILIFWGGECQVFDSHVRSSNYALLAITELPNNELTSIHTLSLPPLLL